MKIYEPMPGDTITETTKRVVALAKKTEGLVTAKFNDIALTAKPDDNPDAIAQYYHTESKRRHEEYINSPEYKKRQREAEEAQRRQNWMLEGALEVAPEKMTLRDEEGWKKAVAADADISFVERWARLMESRMANGDTLEACADAAFSLANNEGITGFMYGHFMSIFSQVWIHGEQLRRWHNLKTQIGHEGEKANESGGVLNPALLSLG